MTNPHTQARDEADLLPCPFCGEKLVRSDYWGGSTRWHPSEGSCFLRGKMVNKVERKKWNTRAACDDGAADLMDRLRKENERLRQAVEGLLRCPAISDGDLGSDAWGCPESLRAEIETRATLTPHDAVTPETSEATE